MKIPIFLIRPLDKNLRLKKTWSLTKLVILFSNCLTKLEILFCDHVKKFPISVIILSNSWFFSRPIYEIYNISGIAWWNYFFFFGQDRLTQFCNFFTWSSIQWNLWFYFVNIWRNLRFYSAIVRQNSQIFFLLPIDITYNFLYDTLMKFTTFFNDSLTKFTFVFFFFLIWRNSWFFFFSATDWRNLHFFPWLSNEICNVITRAIRDWLKKFKFTLCNFLTKFESFFATFPRKLRVFAEVIDWKFRFYYHGPFDESFFFFFHVAYQHYF